MAPKTPEFTDQDRRDLADLKARLDLEFQRDADHALSIRRRGQYFHQVLDRGLYKIEGFRMLGGWTSKHFGFGGAQADKYLNVYSLLSDAQVREYALGIEGLNQMALCPDWLKPTVLDLLKNEGLGAGPVSRGRSAAERELKRGATEAEAGAVAVRVARQEAKRERVKEPQEKDPPDPVKRLHQRLDGLLLPLAQVRGKLEAGTLDPEEHEETRALLASLIEAAGPLLDLGPKVDFRPDGPTPPKVDFPPPGPNPPPTKVDFQPPGPNPAKVDFPPGGASAGPVKPASAAPPPHKPPPQAPVRTSPRLPPEVDPLMRRLKGFQPLLRATSALPPEDGAALRETLSQVVLGQPPQQVFDPIRALFGKVPLEEPVKALLEKALDRLAGANPLDGWVFALHWMVGAELPEVLPKLRSLSQMGLSHTHRLEMAWLQNWLLGIDIPPLQPETVSGPPPA